jgi:hypothetical protein
LDVKNTSLTELAEEFWRRKGFLVEKKVALRGINGDTYTFAYVLKKPASHTSNEEIGVLVRDWKRSVGVDVLIKTDQIAEVTGIKKIMVLANMFSANARTYAKSRSILLLSRSELISLFDYR